MKAIYKSGAVVQDVQKEMARRLQVQRRAPTFFPFQRLPTELRDKIRLFALPGPRIVEFFFEINESPSPISKAHHITVTSPTKPPGLLRVNKESRNETRRQYKALDLGPGFHTPVNIFIDFDIDTVYLSSIRNPLPHSNPTLTPTPPHAATMTLSQSPQLHHLKTLAIDSSVWNPLSLSFLKACPNLQSLIVAFQKSTLHDIKPASAAETVIFMHDSQYFSDENRQTQGLFAADCRIRVKAFSDWNDARNGVIGSFKQQEEEADGNGGHDVVDVDGEDGDDKFVGWLKGNKTVEEPWLGSNEGLGTVYEVVVEKRVIELRFVTALYPRERIFESLIR